MNSPYITAAIGMVDDDLVAQALNAKAVRRNTFRLRAGVAAACAACVLGGAVIGAYAYFTPASYVSLDVNPSIEYALNIFDRVLSVKGVNDDGRNILEEIPPARLKNKAIDKAVRETINAIAEQGYFPGDSEGGVVIAVSDKQAEKARKLSEQLRTAVRQVAEERALDVAIESMAVGEARVEEARRLGVTPGKLNLVEKLKESAPNADDIDIEEWLNKSVKDIMKETKANKALSKPKESDDGKNADDASGGNGTADVAVDSDKADKSGQGNTPDKAADKNSDKKNPSNSGNNAKPDNAAKKDNGSSAAASSEGGDAKANKPDKPDNNGQSKKSDTPTDLDDGDNAGKASENGSDKGNKAEKSNGSSKSNSSGKDKSAQK